jgi:hypothetical protein
LQDSNGLIRDELAGCAQLNITTYECQQPQIFTPVAASPRRSPKVNSPWKSEGAGVKSGAVAEMFDVVDEPRAGRQNAAGNAPIRPFRFSGYISHARLRIRGEQRSRSAVLGEIHLLAQFAICEAGIRTAPHCKSQASPPNRISKVTGS